MLFDIIIRKLFNNPQLFNGMNVWILIVVLYFIITIVSYGYFCRTEQHYSRKEIAVFCIKYSWLFSLIPALVVYGLSPTVVSVNYQNGVLTHKETQKYFFHESPFSGELIRLKIGTSCIDNYSYETLIYYPTEYAPYGDKEVKLIDKEKTYLIPSETTIRVKGQPSYYFKEPPKSFRTKGRAHSIQWTLDR